MRTHRALFALLASATLMSCACERETAAPKAASVVIATEQVPEKPQAPATPQARVIATVGEVQVRRTGETSWEKITHGQFLGTDDAVRTAPDAQLDISVDEVTVRIHEESELVIEKVEKSSLRAKAQGRIEGDVPEGKGVLEIHGRGSDAIVRTDGGRFSMTSDGRGIVAVATVRGSVKLASRGAEVTLAEGQQSRVKGDTAPDKPSKTLSRVLLKVAWPEKETRKATAPITGQVAPGSRVTVQGRKVEVRPDGSFTTEVPLVRGRQHIAVTATDVLGRKSTATTKLMRDDELELGVRERPAWSQ